MRKLCYVLTSMFLFLFFITNSVAQIAGKVFVTSECASGGFDYYFFNDKTVVAECDGCEYMPFILWGTYSISGDKVIVEMYESWFGKGEGEILHVSSINHYERYVARFEQYDERFELDLDVFENGIPESCEYIDSWEDRSSDPHDWLRCNMEGDYPETYLRRLTDVDLKDKSKKELRLMRNEIFARYGYIFGSADMKAHFEAMTGYCKFSKDVEAFLSDIEKENVNLIQEYEKK